MPTSAIAIFGAAPLTFHGGGEVSVRQLAEHWTDAGHAVTYFSDSGTREPLRTSPGDAADGVRFELREILYRSGTYLPGGLALDQPLPEPEALRPYSLRLLLLYRVPPPSYLVELARLPGPVVLLFHGVSVERGWNPDPRIMLFRWHQLYRLRRAAAALAAPNLHVQVLNRATSEFLVSAGVDAARVFLIPTAVDTDRYRVGADAGRFRVLFLGRVEKLQKGTSRLVDLVKAAGRREHSTHFVIAGSGGDLERVRTAVRDVPGVEVLGFVEEDRKRQLLADAALLVVTSNLEPYSLSVVEALASGVPVVTTPVAGPEFLLAQDPLFGHVAGFSVAGLERAIENYRAAWQRDPIRYLAERRERRERAVRLFNRARMFALFDSMLEKVTGGAAAR